MDRDLLNDLARLSQGLPDDLERDGILQRIAEDPEARRLFAGLLLPDSEDLSPAGPPCRAVALLQLGVSDTFLKPFKMERVELAGESKKTGDLFEKLSLANLPLTFSSKIFLAFEERTRVGEVCIACKGDRIGLTVEPTGEGDEGDYVEIWIDGRLARGFSPRAVGGRRPIELDMNTAFVLRHGSEPSGVGIRVSSVHFEVRDWMSALVASMFGGEYSKALEILNRVKPDFEGGGVGGFTRRTISRIKSLLASTQMEGLILQPGAPLPAFRTPAVETERITSVLGLVWEGIVETWPVTLAIASPWNPEGTGTVEEVDLPLPVKDLVLWTLRSATGAEKRLPAEGSSADFDLRSGWAALGGWNYLLEGEYSEAYSTFARLEGGPRDPFNLTFGKDLSAHLMLCKAEGKSLSKLRSSSDKVWKQTISDVVS